MHEEVCAQKLSGQLRSRCTPFLGAATTSARKRGLPRFLMGSAARHIRAVGSCALVSSAHLSQTLKS